MTVNEISQNPYIEIQYAKSPYRVYYAKNPSKNNGDTFEKKKEPYSVENSVEDFSYKLAKLIIDNKCDKDNLKKLIRSYVPRTKVNEDRRLLFVNGASAMYLYRTNVSSNNKIHTPRKQIIVDLSKQETMPNVFFNDLVHEMTHNLQINKEKEIMKKIYKDFFEPSVGTGRFYVNLNKVTTKHAEDLISENYNKKLGVIKFITRKNYTDRRDSGSYHVPEHERLSVMQVYDLNVLMILAQEEEAYDIADKMEKKFCDSKLNQRKLARRRRMFKDLKEIVLDDLKNLGMDEEKIKEYKDLICG